MVDSELVATFAPVVMLHRQEELWPASGQDFVARAELVFGGADAAVTVCGRGAVDPDRLTGRGAPYACEGISTDKLTRPFAGGRRAPGLARERGFGLNPDESMRAGAPPLPAEPIYAQAPAYYEHGVERGVGFLTYWFFYPASAIPRRAVEAWERLTGVVAGADAGDEADPEDTAALEELVAAYPSLYASLGHPGVAEWNPIDFARRVRDISRTFARAIHDDLYVAHDGDWERVTVLFAPTGAPNALVCDAHGVAQSTPWNDVQKTAEGHPVVFSAIGSHATVADPVRQRFNIDEVDAAGLPWPTYDTLRPVDDVFGFGGAWGRIGPVSDLTGPLGPSPWKTGRRVAAEASRRATAPR